jgi:hypothetical protein
VIIVFKPLDDWCDAVFDQLSHSRQDAKNILRGSIHIAVALSLIMRANLLFHPELQKSHFTAVRCGLPFR